MHYAFKSLQSPHTYPAGNWRGKHRSITAIPNARHCIMCYIHLACRAAKQRRVHSCRRKRRSANSVAASLPRRSVAASQRNQRRSVAPASQRRSANSVAAWIPRRSVAAPTASQRRSRVAASQRQQRRSVAPASQRRSVAAPTASQRHWPNGSVAASQRRSATRPPERRSVAAPPAPRSVTAQRRKPTLRPPLPLHCKTGFLVGFPLNQSSWWLEMTSRAENDSGSPAVTGLGHTYNRRMVLSENGGTIWNNGIS